MQEYPFQVTGARLFTRADFVERAREEAGIAGMTGDPGAAIIPTGSIHRYGEPDRVFTENNMAGSRRRRPARTRGV